MSASQYLAVAQIAAAALMWVLQGLIFHQTDQLFQLSLKGFAAAAFVSIIACVLCYVVLYWLLTHIEGHKLGLFDGFHTLSATLFGYLFFQEPVKPVMLLGGALILTGLVLGNLPITRRSQS
jgi:drug/metabolite transporter (DMT)-like permease